MVKIKEKKVGYLDLYRSQLFESKEFRQVLIDNKLTMSEYLNKTTQEFQKKLFEDFVDNIEIFRKTPFAGISEKISKLTRIEGNELIIPLNEITNLLNFTLTVEFDALLENVKQENEIGKFSDLNKKKNVQKFQSPEETFDNETVLEKILSISKLYTNSYEYKNDKLIIIIE